MIFCVRCGAAALAFDATHVERAVLGADAQRLPMALSAGRAGTACVGLLIANARAYAAWDLCKLLKLNVAAENWVLFSGAGAGGPVSFPLALGVGACLGICAKPARFEPLPSGLLRERRGLVTGALPAQDLKIRAGVGAPVCLFLELRNLLSAGERKGSEQMLGRALDRRQQVLLEAGSGR